MPASFQKTDESTRSRIRESSGMRGNAETRTASDTIT